MKPRTLVLTALVVCLPLVASCGTAGTSAQPVATLPPVLDVANVTAEGRVEPVRYMTVSPATAGLVSEVLVKEGDIVRAGGLIARIQDSQAQSLETAQTSAAQELTAAYEAVREAQKALDAYPVPRVFVGMTAEEAARTWLQKLEAVRANFAPYADSSHKSYKWNHRFVSLPPKILFDTNQFEGLAKEYKKQVDLGWVYYRRACAWLDLESQLETAEARLVEAQRVNDNLQDAAFSPNSAGTRGALADAELRAPFDGTITSLDLKAGQYVEAGSPVATIGDLTGWVVKTTNLSEIDVVDVRDQHPVTVTLDAMPGKTFRGMVTAVAQNYSVRQGDIVYEATILLTDIDPNMRWGLTAQITFLK
jgi:multidrug efflux pump subunit AcrA (membrane-fusion protein)